MSPMSSASPVPPVLPMSPPMPVAPDTTREGGRRESSGSNGSNGMIGTSGLIGSSVIRPDAVDKARGDFAFSSDLWAEGMLWGKVLRSPHPSARILSIDTARAQQMPGVMAVLTWADLPGDQVFGLDAKDQPVFAHDVVRYAGEPIAAVAATHPELARQAVDAIVVDFEPAIPLVDPDEALSAPATHEAGNVFRHITLRHGDIKAEGDVVVEGTYEVGMQDQAFMGPESGLAIPSSDGSVDLYISTQWLHVDRDQVAACLGLPPELVRLHLAGVGGAFGAREDITIQVQLCLLALRTRRPVKMVFSRAESFLGHVHRHPARMWYRHHARRDGTLVKVEARIVLDGGAYMSSSAAVIANATCFAAGPYRVPSAAVDGFAVRTNNPPCGAMRGFGAVQVCFAYESQMDRLADALQMDPIELRLKNAICSTDRLITGQVVGGTAPVAEVIRAAAEAPLPEPASGDLLELPGGAGRCAEYDKVVRGTGFAVGFKNLLYSEGFDDFSTARCRLDGDMATITCAAAEVGQGFVTLARQVATETLGVTKVRISSGDTNEIGSAGSTSASRQSWMSGGAVLEACKAVADRVLSMAADTLQVRPETLRLSVGYVVSGDGIPLISLNDLTRGKPVEESVVFHHKPTDPLDSDGQGNAHVSFAFVAHKAVVDVDVELGLVRVVQLSTAQDVGKVLNPLQLLGQIEGGTLQGVGLAVMEELLVADGIVQNPSFTDYLIPTTLDAPDIVVTRLVEEPDPLAPFGAKGAGEMPAISSTPAVVSAIRNATGLALSRVPVRPQDIAFGYAKSDSA